MNKIFLISVFSILTLNVMAQEKIVQTAGRTQLGEFAPKFAELNDDVLFGEVWSRTNKLGLRDRSLVTVTSHRKRPYQSHQRYRQCMLVNRKQRFHPTA